MRDPVARDLRSIGGGASLGDVFDVLARVGAPVRGSVAVYEASRTPELVLHTTLPRELVASVLTLPTGELDRVVEGLLDAPDGATFPERFSSRTPSRASSRHGLSKALLVKLASRSTPRGREVRVLTVRTDAGATLETSAIRHITKLAPEIRAAIDRLSVPIVYESPILSQVLLEQRAGIACATDDGEIIEVNRRAHELAPRYVPRDETEDALAAIVKGAIARSDDGAPLVIRSLDGASLLDVAVHAIKRRHAGGPLHLVILKEIVIADVPTARGILVLGKLSPRQREAAMYLVDTGMAYRSIADAMGVSEGTLRKHVEFLYRSLHVHSRAELAALLK